MVSSTAPAASPMHAGDPPASAARRHLEDPWCAAVVEAQVEALLAVGTRDEVSRDELIKRTGYRHFDFRSILGPECPPHGVCLESRLAHGARDRRLDGLFHRP